MLELDWFCGVSSIERILVRISLFAFVFLVRYFVRGILANSLFFCVGNISICF